MSQPSSPRAPYGPAVTDPEQDVQTSGRNTVVVDGAAVRKEHGGPDGPRRAVTAAAALRHAAAHALWVPELRTVDGATLVTAVVPDVVTGAALLVTSPATVLHAVGSVARQLHALPPPPGLAVPSGGSAVWVHGDLCPVNLLFGADHVLRAVVDWEDSHVGHPLVDLVWTEWLVRTWHAHAIEALPVLYAAYARTTPSASARRAAMRACLLRHDGRDAQSVDWQHHLAALDDLDLSL